jgi:hypothetical protein
VIRPLAGATTALTAAWSFPAVAPIAGSWQRTDDALPPVLAEMRRSGVESVGL